MSSQLNGKVYDNNNLVVKNAKVEIAKYKIVTETDENGNFSINITKNQFPLTLTIYKFGFISYSKKLIEYQDNLNIILSKAPTLNEAITVNPFGYEVEESVFPIPHNTVESDEIFNLSPEMITDVLKNKSLVDVIGGGDFQLPHRFVDWQEEGYCRCWMVLGL